MRVKVGGRERELGLKKNENLGNRRGRRLKEENE